MKTTDYVLNEDYKKWDVTSQDWMIVPSGTFVKPIHHTYIPKHIQDKHKWWDKSNETFVYCSYGILPVPKRIIREK